MRSRVTSAGSGRGLQPLADGAGCARTGSVGRPATCAAGRLAAPSADRPTREDGNLSGHRRGAAGGVRDQGVAEGGEIEATLAGGVRQQAAASKAGHGVDLQQPRPAGAVEHQVDARQVAAADDAVCLHAKPLDLAPRRRRAAGRSGGRRRRDCIWTGSRTIARRQGRSRSAAGGGRRGCRRSARSRRSVARPCTGRTWRGETPWRLRHRRRPRGRSVRGSSRCCCRR